MMQIGEPAVQRSTIRTDTPPAIRPNGLSLSLSSTAFGVGLK